MPTLDDKFDAFVKANPWVVTRLAFMALELVENGRSRIGMKMLFEVLRWELLTSTHDDHSDFKLNNSYASRMARLLMERYPKLDGHFETRALLSRQEAA